MALRGILFDMGGTLLRFRPDHISWEALEKGVGQQLYTFLHTHDYPLPPEDEALERYWEHFHSFWENPTRFPVSDLKLDAQMITLARLWGLDNLPGAIIHGLGQSYMNAMRAHVQPMEGAVDTLRDLRERGLRVGLISNTIWPEAEHIADLQHHRLAPYIEHYVFSGDAESWKPDSDIFQRGLAPLALAPGEAAYVGDSLYFDVWGAQQAGLRGVWIKPQGSTFEDPAITPDAWIHTLPELLPLVDQWRAEG